MSDYWDKVHALKLEGNTGRFAELKASGLGSRQIRERTRWNGVQFKKYRERAKRQAAEHGITPSEDFSPHIPANQKWKGASVQTRNAAGELVWIKTNERMADAENRIKEAYAGLSEGFAPPKILTPTKPLDADLLNLFIVTDLHLGMLAWGAESGDKYDTETAENIVMRYFESAIADAPEAERALLVILGDFMHWDGLLALTPAHRHVLDAADRFGKLCKVAARCLIRITSQLAATHKNVDVILVEGNHDEASTNLNRVWMTELFRRYPQIKIDQSPAIYHGYQFGDVGLYFHHGHKKTPQTVDRVFAGQFRAIFGATKYSYGHMGDKHHRQKDEGLMIVEQHATLAAKDAYAARGGWLSERRADRITYHRKFGEYSRGVFTIARVLAESEIYSKSPESRENTEDNLFMGAL